MVEAVRAANRAPVRLPDRLVDRVGGLVGDGPAQRLSGVLGDYVVPVAMALVFLASLLLFAERASYLLAWDDLYDGEGRFLVERCEADRGLGSDRWVCQGRVDTELHQGTSGQLITSLGAYTSDRPYLGERYDVFFPTGDARTVYPLGDRLNELARLYLSLLPRLLVLVGSVIWLLGWALTRRHLDADFVTRDRMRLPQRFGWQRQGITWIVAGLGLLVFNHLLTRLVLGSLGLA